MVWWALRLDPRRKAAWRALLDIVESVLHLVPEEEQRLRKAVEMVRRWLDGEASRGELLDAARDAANAAFAANAAYAAYAANAAYAAAKAAAHAAYAAANAAYVAADAAADVASAADAAVSYAARADAAASATHAHIVRKHIPCVPWPSDYVVPSPAPGGGGRGRGEE
jgi:hypothetical protein